MDEKKVGLLRRSVRSVGSLAGRGGGLLSRATGWTFKKTHRAYQVAVAAPSKVLDRIEEKLPVARFVTKPVGFVGHYMYRGLVITMLFALVVAPPLAAVLSWGAGVGACTAAFLLAIPAFLYTLVAVPAVWIPLLQIAFWVGTLCLTLDILGWAMVKALSSTFGAPGGLAPADVTVT